MEISKTKTISFTEFWNELKYPISDYFDEKNPDDILPKTMKPFIETLSLINYKS